MRMIFGVILSVLCLLFTAPVYSSQELSVVNDTTLDTGDYNSCPIWYTGCECQRGKKFFHSHAVCESEDQVLRVQNCYCLWYSEDDAETLLAPCFHTCYHPHGIFHYHINLTRNFTEFNQLMCSGVAFGLNLHRNPNSRLCGKCAKDYGLPAYSYQLSKCVECKGHNYLLYIAAAFVPLTLFYFLVISFRISATSGNLKAYVFFSQVISTPLYMRLFVNAVQAGHYHHSVTYLKIFYSAYGIWNLDFFRLFYKPFCIHRHVTARDTISLDYIVAFYPLILIVCTYFFVLLHERDFKLIVFLWKPFHQCFARFRSQWNIKKSLVHAFSTFLLLSYVKILNVSFDLFLPTVALVLPQETVKTYLYYDPTVSLFDRYHLYFFVLAVLITLLCVIVPLVLMLCYPCHCFHKYISKPEFYIFMDTFTGCYRQKPSYCKAFVGIYFTLQIIILVVFETAPTLVYIPTISAVVMFAAILVAIARPYKKLSHNITDVFFLIFLAICFNFQSEVLMIKEYDSNHNQFALVYTIMLALPPLYPIFLVLRFLYRSSIMQAALGFFRRWSVMQKIRERYLHRESRELLDSVQDSRSHYRSVATVGGPVN